MNKNLENFRIAPRISVETVTGKVLRYCGLAHCERKHYGRGLCGYHYQRLFDGKLMEPEIDWSGPKPDCNFEGCTRASVTHSPRTRRLCWGHISQFYAGKELTPLKYSLNEGYTEKGRICKTCHKEKPLDEFYDRNQGRLASGKVSKARKCKTCFKKDVAYYQGKRATKADGSDPRGYGEL